MCTGRWLTSPVSVCVCVCVCAGLGSLDSGVIVVGAEHIGLLWGVEKERPAAPR